MQRAHVPLVAGLIAYARPAAPLGTHRTHPNQPDLVPALEISHAGCRDRTSGEVRHRQERTPRRGAEVSDAPIAARGISHPVSNGCGLGSSARGVRDRSRWRSSRVLDGAGWRSSARHMAWPIRGTEPILDSERADSGLVRATDP